MIEDTPSETNLTPQTVQNEQQPTKEIKRGIVKGPKDGQMLTVKFNGKDKQNFSNLKQTKILILIIPVVYHF